MKKKTQPIKFKNGQFWCPGFQHWKIYRLNGQYTCPCNHCVRPCKQRLEATVKIVLRKLGEIDD